MSRIALVTGATRGIGKAIAITLQKSGYLVAATFHDNYHAAVEFREETGIEIFKWDVRNYESCLEGVASVRAKLGTPEILVNNAGITRDSMLHKMSVEQWHEVISTNLTSCFNMVRAVIEDMRAREFGRIINISSINAIKGQIGQTNYCAAKAGLIGFTKALAQECGRKGITANVIAPGYIDTDMLSSISPQILDSILLQIPIGRLGRVEEISRMVEFLASDEASLITGTTLHANGGQYM
ncbi:MAG: acetoacetyl-CoA reductase, partial [Alphaproteobacteria bacterium]|nr:acetoacetyl-CoA reductase [Alphaproteobacteria bacterium]